MKQMQAKDYLIKIDITERRFVGRSNFLLVIRVTAYSRYILQNFFKNLSFLCKTGHIIPQNEGQLYLPLKWQLNFPFS